MPDSSIDAQAADTVDRAFRRHYGQIYRFVLRRTHDHETAEDLTQEVFLAAVSGLGEFVPNGPPVLAWLYAVAQRRLLDEHRRRSRASLERLPLEAALPTEAVDGFYQAEVAHALLAGVSQLTNEQRAVVVMILFEGRSIAETAEELKLTEGACKMRLQRALASVRTVLACEGFAP